VLQFSSLPGTATLYFDVSGPWIRMSIYQGNTLIKTANGANSLTAGQRTMLRTDPAPKAWFDTNVLGTLVANTVDPDGGKVTGSGTITWTHNPAGGRDYTIVTQSAGGRFHWRWALNFPMDITTFSCPNPPTATPASYTGVMEVTPSLIKMRPASNSDQMGFTLDGQFYHAKVTGLKPVTKHNFQIGDSAADLLVRADGTNPGENLISTANGTLEFDFYVFGIQLEIDSVASGTNARTITYTLTAPGSSAQYTTGVPTINHMSTVVPTDGTNNIQTVTNTAQSNDVAKQTNGAGIKKPRK
jgi:hypothetical protein